MNKRTYNRVCRIYNDGLTTEMAISMIIMLATGYPEASKYILKFMKEQVFPRWRDTKHYPPMPDSMQKVEEILG